MRQTSDPLQALVDLACPEGGWGYTPGQGPHLEPTCLALLALAGQPQRFGAALDGGRAWLGQSAMADGSYRLRRGRPEAVWPTALVLFTQAVLGKPIADLHRTAGALLAFRRRQPDRGEDAEVNDIDVTLNGWPWAEDNFSWIEPTAWACLALRRMGQGEHPRVREGLKMLLDRALDEGGCNYGNRRIFGRVLEPLPGPTALMLLALQGVPGEPRIRAAVQYLRERALVGEDLEHLCWARMALDLYRDHPGVEGAIADLGQRIEAACAARTATPYLRPAPLRQALTALALQLASPEHQPEAPARGSAPPSLALRACRQAAPNPFRLPGDLPQQGDLTAGKPLVCRRPLGERIRGALRGLAVHAATQLRPLAPQSAAHIAPVADYNADLADVVRRQYEDFRARVPLAGKRVVLKPNLVEYHRDKVINTHPHVVAAAIELCQREGAAEVLVAEGPGHCRNVEYLVAASGLGDVLRHYKVPFVDLNHDEPVRRINLGRLTGLEYLYLSQTIAAADVVISLPKLKTHHWAVATLSLKNLFGTLPGICYGWPKNELHWRGIDNSIVDIAATRTPDLAIVDGIIGMEGDGPLNGSPRQMGVLVMGCDLVAADATCCRLMQLAPEKIGYLVLGHRKKLGLLAEGQIRQLGETIASRRQPFDTLPHFRPAWLGRPS
jgi:uncharacterized protein (DUF362 family)